MTATAYAEKHTGTVILIPKGTRTGKVIHEYQLSTGEWSPNPHVKGETWKDLPRRMRYEETVQDQYVELVIDPRGLELLALKATKNRNGRTTDGPLTLKRRR